MRKTITLLLLSAALAAGCDSGDNDFAIRPGSNDPGAVQARAIIPSAGGEVPIPDGTGISGRLLFDPGAAAGTQISMTSSLERPARLQGPLVGLSSPNATTQDYFFLTFSVDKPTPLSLFEGVRLQGAIPAGHEHYHADIYQLGGDGLAQAVDGQSTFLQEFPGERDDTGATFDEIQDGATLQPGVEHVMRFKSTDQELLEFKIVNDSGITPCYVFIKGQNPNIDAKDNRFYYVNVDGELVPMDVDDLKDGFADYNIPVPADGKIKLPLVLSGRAYISLGEKMKTQLNARVLPTDPPAAWVAPNGTSNPGDPNYNTLWDFVEFDYKISPDSKLPGMGVNTTQVQLTGIPTTLTMTGPTSGTQISGAKGAGTRSTLMAAIAADPEFKTLIVEGTGKGTNVSPLRVASADEGIKNVRANIPNVPTFDTAFYDSYIDQVWEKYKSEDLIMETSAFGTYLGRVNAQNQMIFTQANKRSVIVPKPGTTDVIVGDGLLLFDLPNAKTDEEKAVVGEIASCMSACFNRTTLLVFNKLLRNPIAGTFDPKIFYQNAPTNLYAKLAHSLSLPTTQAPEGGAYGFGFDDNLNQSSVIIDNKAPTSLTITIPKF